MKINMYGLVMDTPRVTFYLWSPWRAAALEHRIFQAVEVLPGLEKEHSPDEQRLHITDPRTWRAALENVSRVLKGWQEEADPGVERRSWRWLLEGDCDADGFDHNGDRFGIWALLRARIESGGPADAERPEDIDLEGFGLRIWACDQESFSKQE
jgi:hypothetical protein